MLIINIFEIYQKKYAPLLNVAETDYMSSEFKKAQRLNTPNKGRIPQLLLSDTHTCMQHLKNLKIDSKELDLGNIDPENIEAIVKLKKYIEDKYNSLPHGAPDDTDFNSVDYSYKYLSYILDTIISNQSVLYSKEYHTDQATSTTAIIPHSKARHAQTLYDVATSSQRDFDDNPELFSSPIQHLSSPSHKYGSKSVSEFFNPEEILNDPAKEQELYKKINDECDFILLKSVRYDDNDYWGDFVMSVTQKEQLDKGIPLKYIRKPLRRAADPDEIYKVDARGVVKVGGKPKFPQEVKGNKSKPMSTSIAKAKLGTDISKKFFPPVFRFDRTRNEPLVGIIFRSKDLSEDPNFLVSTVLKHDGGTYGRPNRFETKQEAKQYFKLKKYDSEKNPAGTIFSSTKELIEKGKDDKHNEVLARIEWRKNDPRCGLGIFSRSTDPQKPKAELIAQLRAIDLQINLNTRWIPIYYYQPNHTPKVFEYTQKEREAHLEIGLCSNDPEIKIIANMTAFLNGRLSHLYNIENIREQDKLISLLSMDKLTKTTKIIFLEKFLGLNLSALGLNLEQQFKLIEVFSKIIEAFKIDLIYITGTHHREKISLNQYFYNCLHLAANSLGHQEVVNSILEEMIKRIILYNNVNTLELLSSFARKGDSMMVKALLNHLEINIGVNGTRDGYIDYYLQALIIASKKGHLELVKELLKNPNINVNKASGGLTALHYAAENGHLEVVKELLKNPNINVSIQDDECNTPLMLAIKMNHIDCALAIITAETKKNNKIELIIPCQKTELELAVSSGCSIGQKTALELAISSGYSIEIVIELIFNELNIAIKNNNQGRIMQLLDMWQMKSLLSTKEKFDELSIENKEILNLLLERSNYKKITLSNEQEKLKLINVVLRVAFFSGQKKIYNRIAADYLKQKFTYSSPEDAMLIKSINSFINKNTNFFTQTFSKLYNCFSLTKPNKT